jgi:hypothetical protein
MNHTIAYERPARNFFQAPQFGVSAEAHRLEENYSELYEQIQASFVFGGQGQMRRDALIELFREASSPNWDGYGAQAVSFESYCKADSFLKLLPSALELPDISAHPDGEIAFEWRTPPRKILTISLGARGVITFAGIFGGKERHGVEYFVDEIPSEILELFDKLLA